MRIGELAGEPGLNLRTIRGYRSIGLLPEPERTAGNYRDYGNDLAGAPPGPGTG